jgi:tetratricopeptide (TPR) repeat protein
MLLGRAAELAAVDAALATAAEGRGRLLLFVGEAGIGKTRLADEASSRARARGLRVAWGRTWEGAGALPCWPWTQIVRELLDDGVPLAPSEAAQLSSIVPELVAAEPPPVEADGFRTFDALLQLLRRAARAAPRLLVLDDLHAADRSTLLGLHFVARALRDLPLAVIATHREAEARVRADARDQLERIAREGTRLTLSRLGEADVAALLAERIGPAAAEASRAVHRSTEGNPLYVHEVARLLASDGGVRQRQMPDGIRAAVAGHVALLRAPTRRLVGVAALFGRTFSRAALRAVAGIGDDEVAAALDEAAEAGVVTASPEGAAFTHVLLAEALASQLPSSERARLHGAIAAWWMARAGGDARSSLAEIAHHLLEADGDPAEAIGWARRAASTALQRFAFDQAADLYARALAFVPRLGDGARVGIELVIGRGEALAKACAFDEALALCEEAARQARAIGAADLEARAAIASASYFNSLVPNPEVVALLERALEHVGESAPAWRARLLAQLSCTVYPSPVPGHTAGLAAEAIAIARRLEDPEVLLPVLHDASISGLPHTMRSDERLALGRELSALARSLEDAPALMRGRIFEVFGAMERGDRVAVEEELRSMDRSLGRSIGRSLGGSGGAIRERSLLCLVRALDARMQGRFAEADACIEEACEIGLPEDEPRHRSLHAWAQAYTRGNRDDLRAARGFGDIRIPPFGGAWVAAAIGELDEARARLRAPLPSGDLASPAMLAALADACVLAADAVAAEALYPILLGAAGELLAFGPVISIGPVDRILGGLATLRGDRVGAAAFFERAITLCERAGALPFLARTLAQYGRLLASERPERARTLLDRARALARSMGMETLGEEIEGIEAPRAPAARAVPPAPSVTLAREGETWVLSDGASEVRLRDSKGLAYLDELLRQPHREIHVAELYGRGAGAVELGDAGPLVDASARRRYERRLADLEDELREAEAFADPGRASRAEQEIERLAEELARAVGLGGRERRAASLTERARINVQRRLRDVLSRVARSAPALGRHLELTIKTGTFCSYCPLDPPPGCPRAAATDGAEPSPPAASSASR